MHMRVLYSNLSSLIAPNSSQVPVPELVDRATDYIKGLDSRVKQLHQTKEAILTGEDVSITSDQNHLLDANVASSSSSRSVPIVEVGAFESTLEVNLICGSENMFKLTEVIRVLEEEGAVVITSACHKEGDRVFYTIYSQAKIPRIGIDTSRVHERLKMLFS
ncbi:transcription factor bHLH168-like [Tripterygium wilfordii]|uniref:transcription factor bHLH168-like n=1 Tax=Tripterygium wilfordii TaxID=458696 RepID=UPI0018F84056|nr:transcription factor bHLH168-like [Tripterygium wilfordii]